MTIAGFPEYILYISQEYVYNGEGPKVQHVGLKVSENVTSYNQTLITINRTIIDTPDGVEAVYDESRSYNVEDVIYWGDKTNITLSDSLPLSGKNNVTVNYTYYILVDPIFGYNLTTFPPYNYSHPITNSTYPAIYPFLLEMLSTSHSSIIKMIGNLTSSLAKQYLMLNATFDKNTTIGTDRPIRLLSGFTVIDLFNLFNNLIKSADSPFGNPIEQQMNNSMAQFGGFSFESFQSFDAQSMMGETSPINNMSFSSSMEIYLEPNLQSRFLYNITIPGNFSQYADPIYLPYPDNMTIQGEGFTAETMPSFEGGVEVLGNTTMELPIKLPLKLNPLMITDVDHNGINDTIIVVNGFYPNYNIYCINNTNGQIAWNVSLKGPVESLELDESTNQLIILMRNPEANLTNGDSQYMVSRMYDINGTIDTQFSYIDLTYNNSLRIFYNDSYKYIGLPSFDVQNITSYQVSLRPYILPDNSSIFVVNNEISRYLGNVSGQTIYYDQKNWTREFIDVIEYCKVDDVNNDGELEIIVGTVSGYIFALNMNGTLIWQYRIDGKITDLKIDDINNDGFKDVILSSVDKCLYVLNGTNHALLIKYKAQDIINDVAIGDFDEDGNKDIIFGSSDKFIYVVNSSGHLIWSYNTSSHHNSTNEYIKSVELAYLNGSNNLTIIYGAGDNKLKMLNVSNNETIFELFIGNYITVFHLFRTNESISIQYDLSDPIMSMIASQGEINMDKLLQLFGSGSASAGAMLGSGFSLDINSLLGESSNLDLGIDASDITGMLPSGIGLINLISWQLEMIMSMTELAAVMGAQHEFTGQCEVRGSSDFINPYDYFNVTQNKSLTNNLTRYEIESINDTAKMQVNYFYVLLSDDSAQNHYINESRIQLWVWNGSTFINLMNNSIFNLSLSMLDIAIVNVNTSEGNYTELRFRPFNLLLPLQKQNLTVDWYNRVIFFNVSGNYNESYWIDVSYMHPEVVYKMTMTTITHSITYPVIVVFVVRAPYIDIPPPSLSEIIQMLQSPYIYIIALAASMILIELTYLRKRTEAQLDRVAAKNLNKWLNKRRNSWDILARNGLLYEKQHETLKRFRYRITEATQEHPTMKRIRIKFEKHKFLSQVLYAVFLKDFWFEFGKRNRLAVIMDGITNYFMTPLKKIGNAFLSILPKSKTSKARVEELKKKTSVEEKKPKEKLKEKKKHKKKKEISLNDELIKDIESKLKKDIDSLKKSAPKKKKFKKPAEKKWKGEFKNDGGTKLRETFIRVRKKLPDFFTDEGKIFYALSKNRYIGTTTAELAKVIGKGILETIPILIKLYEKGLIILLQEGEHLSEDLWDVAATLRKSDPDVEKMLYTTKYLEETLNKTLKDLQEEKDSIK